MRIGRTLGLLTLFAGIATYLAARAAMRREDETRRTELDQRLRWETDGGAATVDQQPSTAQFDVAAQQ